MKQMTNRFALTALVLSLSSTHLYAETSLVPAGTTLPSGINAAGIDPAIRIQDDFYLHVNGSWIKNTEIPADRSSWGAFDVLADGVLPQIRGIIESLSNNPATVDGTDAQKISDLYASYMNTEAIEARALTPMQSTLAQIDAVTDKNQLPALIAHFNRAGMTAPYGFGVHQDAKDSTKYIVDLGQSGLGLPDRDYYLKDDDAKLKSVREAYQKHIEKMVAMAGDTNAADSAAAIVKLETAMAQIQWSKVEQRDPVKSYNKIELSRLNVLTPNHDFLSYLKAVGVEGKVSYVIVSQPSYFTGLAKVLQDTSLETWKTYFRWHALSSNAALLSANFADEHFAFYSTTLRGVPQQEVRWKRGVRLTDGNMGEALGKIYVAKYFPPEYKSRMEKLVSNLLAAYKQSVNTLDWMSSATKKEAQIKLATFMPKIGYPEKWRDYSALVIKKDDLVGNNLRANEFETQFEIDKLGKPIDRTEWGMTPQTVNAYYNPEMNEIVFPAAILQPPFFDANADDAVNYGGIGAVIGHEISHGFDDQGSQYDEKGNLRDWWTKQDHKKFSVKTAALVKQYNAFSPLPGYFVNGELTLGENIADNSGLAIAYKAYKIALQGKPAPVIDGLTGEQRFYLGWGQVWQSKSRDEATLVQIKTDPHSPDEFRGNGAVKNQPDFYKAFDVKKGDKMYLPPAARVIIW
ncbi:putative endopeptidase [Oxalobacteraceae bacterium GrIS 1.18]